MKDPLLSTDPAVLDSGSQIINKLEMASAKLKTLPTAKTTSVGAPENKDLHEELASQADGVEPTDTITPEASSDKRFL